MQGSEEAHAAADALMRAEAEHAAAGARLRDAKEQLKAQCSRAQVAVRAQASAQQAVAASSAPAAHLEAARDMLRAAREEAEGLRAGLEGRVSLDQMAECRAALRLAKAESDKLQRRMKDMVPVEQ